MTSNVARQLSDRAVPHRAAHVGRRVFVAISLLIAASGINACASGHAHKGPSRERQIAVNLTNDLAPPADVTVYATASGRVRVLLGDVPPNQHRVLHIPAEIQSGTSFHLVAEKGFGRPVISQAIDATTSDLAIDWTLQSNAVFFPEMK